MEEKSVFISYSSKDVWYVDKIKTMLEKMGVSYWVAPEMIPAGSNYAREIPRAIRDCELFLLILSEHSQESIWVEKELDNAVCCRRKVLPFQVDETPLNDMFRFYLNNVQTINYAKDKKDAVLELKKRIRLICPENKEREKNKIERAKVTFRAKTEKEVEFGGKKYPQKKVEAVTMNHIPEVCEYCGGELKQVAKGTYRCQTCGRDNYDYFRKVRYYLEKAGAQTALEIEKNTGVPRTVVAHLLKEDYLEIPRLSPQRISCEKCGRPIRSGRLCEICKSGRKPQEDGADPLDSGHGRRFWRKQK